MFVVYVEGVVLEWAVAVVAGDCMNKQEGSSGQVYVDNIFEHNACNQKKNIDKKKIDIFVFQERNLLIKSVSNSLQKKGSEVVITQG